MAEVVMIVVGYVAVGVGAWPLFVRYRYGQIRGRHPHTHERDVVRDVMVAMGQAVACSALWLPIVVSRYTLRVGWRLARLVLGRTLRRDYSTARIERMTAELAAMDAPNVVALRPQPAPRREPTFTFDRESVAEMRRLVAEAEQLKRLISDLEAAADPRADEVRVTLRTKVDLMRDVADRVSVAQ